MQSIFYVDQPFVWNYTTEFCCEQFTITKDYGQGVVETRTEIYNVTMMPKIFGQYFPSDLSNLTILNPNDYVFYNLIAPEVLEDCNIGALEFLMKQGGSMDINVGFKFVFMCFDFKEISFN